MERPALVRPLDPKRRQARFLEIVLRLFQIFLGKTAHADPFGLRRAGTPRLRATHPDVPPAFEAVVRRCLAPDPGDRYASATQLAADLQAVADDGPLRFAREPIPSRCVRWLRRNRRRLAVGGPLVLALAVSVYLLIGAQLAAFRRAATGG